MAALLYTAEALRNVPTDTEVRFLSFTDEENGKNGSRTYTASLTEEERTRIVGAIQFDMLGGLGSTGTLVCTVDGEANWSATCFRKRIRGWRAEWRPPATIPRFSSPEYLLSC